MTNDNINDSGFIVHLGFQHFSFNPTEYPASSYIVTIGRDGKPLIINIVPGVSAVTSITSSTHLSAAAGLSPQPSPSNCQHRHQEIRVTERQGRRQQSGPYHHPDSH